MSANVSGYVYVLVFDGLRHAFYFIIRRVQVVISLITISDNMKGTSIFQNKSIPTKNTKGRITN